MSIRGSHACTALLLVGAIGATEGPVLRVDVGGHHLRARMTGTSGPTVVLEAALGNSLEAWEPVVPAISEFARVIAYDRAGIGESDQGPRPRTPTRIAEELAALLAKVEARPPYVLVGHSAGGFHVRAFAALYPDRVGALVMVPSVIASGVPDRS